MVKTMLWLQTLAVNWSGIAGEYFVPGANAKPHCLRAAPQLHLANSGDDQTWQIQRNPLGE